MSYAVIIPSYNRPEMLKRSLASVYAQAVLPAKIHLVIDESEDREKYAFLDHYDDVLDVTFSGGGCGGAKARNLGLDRVKDVDFVFFLDDDDEWLPEKSEKQMVLLERRADAVGVTCACYRCSGDTRSIVSRDEAKINRYVKLWNFTGGFSCFGFRWNEKTRGLRLRAELMSAQDFEFYMRIVEEGSIALCSDPLLLFHMHEGERISGDRIKKRDSFMEILEINSNHFNLRDRLFNEAKGDLLCAPDLNGLGDCVVMYLKGTLKLLCSFQLFFVSKCLWVNSSRGLLTRLLRR